MEFKITIKYLIPFCLLTLLFVEVHEQGHAILMTVFFNNLKSRTFTSCISNSTVFKSSDFTIIGGPILTYLFMWIGKFLMSSFNNKKRLLGFSLIFACLPVARQLSCFDADEFYFFNFLLGDTISSKIIAILFTFSITLPPLITAYRFIQNKNKIKVFFFFYLFPVVFFAVYLNFGMNMLLNTGFLSECPFFGTPNLILIHTSIILLLLIYTWKNIDIETNNPTCLLDLIY